jgi:hypothetical protein
MLKPISRSIAVTVLFVLCGCKNHPTADKPSDVVKRLYQACNEARYSDAEKYISREDLHSDLMARAGGIKGACDGNTKGRTLTSMDVVSEKIHGEKPM